MTGLRVLVTGGEGMPVCTCSQPSPHRAVVRVLDGCWEQRHTDRLRARWPDLDVLPYFSMRTGKITALLLSGHPALPVPTVAGDIATYFLAAPSPPQGRDE